MQYLLEFGLANALLAALMALGVYGFQRFFKNPHLMAILWMIVFLRLIMPPLVSLPISIPRGGTESAAASREPLHPINQNIAEHTSTGFRANDHLPAQTSVVSDEFFDDIQQSGTPTTSPVSKLTASQQSLGAAAPIFGNASDNYKVALIWLTGSGLWLSLVMVRAMRFDRLVRQAPDASADIYRTVAKLASRLGMKGTLSVRVVDGAISPMVWAFGRQTVILLPRPLLSQLSREQQEMLLTHELAHVRRGDHWLRWLEAVTLALYWWYPVVWWMQKQLHRTHEECCDAHVLDLFPKRARIYGEALLSTVELIHQQPKVPLWANEFGGNHHLKQRIETMLNQTISPRLSRRVQRALLVCGAILLGLSIHWSEADAQPLEASGVKETPTLAVEEAARPTTSGANGNGATPTGVTTETLRQAWKQRLAKTRACRIVWRNEYTQERSYIVRRIATNNIFERRSTQRTKESHLPESIQYEDEAKISFSGPRMRYETSGARVVLRDGRLQPQAFHAIDVSDGVLSKSFTAANATTPHPYGRIYHFAVCDAAGKHETFPIRACFLPFMEQTASREFPLKVLLPATEADIAILGEKNPKAVVFKQRYDFYDTGRGTLMSFDPDKQYNLTRFVSMHDKTTKCYILDISYEYKAELELWVPKQWRYTQFDRRGQKMDFSRISTVTSLEHNL